MAPRRRGGQKSDPARPAAFGQTTSSPRRTSPMGAGPTYPRRARIGPYGLALANSVAPSVARTPPWPSRRRLAGPSLSLLCTPLAGAAVSMGHPVPSSDPRSDLMRRCIADRASSPSSAPPSAPAPTARSFTSAAPPTVRTTPSKSSPSTAPTTRSSSTRPSTSSASARCSTTPTSSRSTRWRRRRTGCSASARPTCSSNTSTARRWTPARV